jgi:hypothetical protein
LSSRELAHQNLPEWGGRLDGCELITPVDQLNRQPSAAGSYLNDAMYPTRQPIEDAWM